MAEKRLATSNLNHENWDEEDEPEERGTFRKASENELKNRVIKKARRKVATGSSGADSTYDGGPKSVFSAFAGFGKPTSSTPTASPFSFLSKIGPPSDSTSTSGAPKNTSGFSFGTSAKTTDLTDKKDITSPENGSLTKDNTKHNLGKSASYQRKIKNLNQAVSEWIKTHVDKNPLCILSPIFNDYEKYLKEIEEEEQNGEKSLANITVPVDNTLTLDAGSAAGSFKFSSTPPKPTAIASTSTAAAMFSIDANTGGPKTSSVVFSSVCKSANEATKPCSFSFGIKSPESKSIGSSTQTAEATKPSTFSFGIKSPENKNSGTDTKTASVSKGFSFGLKSDDKPSTTPATPFTFGIPATTNGNSANTKPASFSFTPGATSISFGNIKPPAATPSTSGGASGADDEEDQPPKVEFKQVVEEDSVYSKKCKIFVKKDGAFADRGVGTLYLKPVKDSEKTQLLVRADTNLGNILVNLILSAGIPTQRMGKNNVMLVCIPTPDVEKATSILIRVKTGDEADELLAELEKYKK